MTVFFNRFDGEPRSFTRVGDDLTFRVAVVAPLVFGSEVGVEPGGWREHVVKDAEAVGLVPPPELEGVFDSATGTSNAEYASPDGRGSTLRGKSGNVFLPLIVRLQFTALSTG